MSKLSVSPGILDITPYVPGRQSAEGGNRLILLSSNETPLGSSPLAAAAYTGIAERLHRYPDGGAWGLRDALAEHYSMVAARITCGNGSDELLTLLAQAYGTPGDEVLITEHAFAIYKIAAQAQGATPVITPESGYTADVDALLARATERTRICYLANPNNPTGTYIPSAELRRLRAGLPEHTLLVIDAAYAEYMRRDDYEDGRALVDEGDNVVMTRTFSKIYGLCALRLGWMYAPESVVDVVNRIRGPFNVNAPAQAAGIAALRDSEFLERAATFNERWIPRLETGIGGLGLHVHPSAANFVLVEFPEAPGHTAADAYAFLLARGIVPRRLDNYGLPKCLRFSLGTEEENSIVLRALGELVAG